MHNNARRIAPLLPRTPFDLKNALRTAALQIGKLLALQPVNAHAAPAGDIATNGIARQRLTAARHLMHQAAKPLDANIAVAAFFPGRQAVDRKSTRLNSSHVATSYA